MKITIDNGQEYEVEPDAWKLARCRDFTRPSELNLTLSRRIPISDRSKVEAEEGGKIWFRGYVFSQDIKSKNEKTAKCYGVEDLLFRRQCPRYGLTRSFAGYGSAYEDTWKPVYKLFEDANPSLDQHGPRLGLIYMANSAVPDGLIEHYDDANWTFKVAGFGAFPAASAVEISARASGNVAVIVDDLGRTYYSDGAGWTQFGNVLASKISTSNAGTVIVGRADGYPYYLSGDSFVLLSSASVLTDISIADDGTIYGLISGVPHKWSGAAWVSLAGSGTRIAAKNSTTVYIRGGDGSVSYHDGSWHQLSATVVEDLSVASDGSIVSLQGGVTYYWGGAAWVAYGETNGVKICIPASGYTWLITTVYGIWKYAGSWAQYSVSDAGVTFNGRALATRASLANCQATADSYYRDATDLYIHPDATDFPDAIRGILCIENAFDTTIRLGEYSEDLDSESVHMANYQISGDDVYGDVMKSIADWHGLDIAVRYDPDGYTYIDVLDDPGEGAASGKIILTEDDIADIQTKSPSEIVPQVLFGKGYGGQDARQRYTRVDVAADGFWLHGNFEYADGFVDSDNPFMGLVNAEWERLQNLEKIYTIKTLRPQQINPYDYVRLRLEGESEKILPVDKLEYDSKSNFTLSLGNRDVDILDMFNSRGEAQCYAKDMLREGDLIWSASDEISVTPGDFLGSDGSITWGTPGSVEIGCSASYVTGATRVILDVSTEEDLYWNWVTLLLITCDDVANDNTFLRFYKTLDSSDGIDITDICPPGATRTFKFYLLYTGELTTGVPNPVVVNYTVKYVITDDASAWAPPEPPEGETQVTLYDGSLGSASPNYPPYLAGAYTELDGQLGRPEPADCTGMTKANGTLHIELRAEWPDRLTSDGEIELCSGGGSNLNEWHIAVPYTEITVDWKTFDLPLSGAVTVGGELDVAAINYVMWWNTGTARIDIGWRRAYVTYEV